ncbi:hypothetical protein CSUI_010946 [Cystoisospora suis]|uniref:Uncharacterized protein n=1 Tax=Cystoisospora suis TaxID=483139 RepID=A0A2C6KFT9_9APIC|nr:hypothetical protein CSUI_010946 [Cystoisospora suis]
MDTSSRPPEVVVISTPAASSDGVCQSPASEGDVSASGSEARKEASSLSAKRNNGGLPSRSPSPSSEQSCKTNKKVRTSSTNDEAKDTIPRGRTHAATGTSLSSPSSSRTATKMIQSSSSSPSSSSLALPSSASTGANGTSPTSSAMEASSRSTSPRETSTTTTAARTVNKRGGRSPGDALQPPTSGHCSTSTSACPPSTVTTSPSQQQQHHTPQSREIVLIRKFTLDQFQQRLQDLRSRRGLIQVFNFRDTVLPSAYCMALFFSTAASAPQLTKFLMYYLEKMPASQFRVLCAGITKCRHLRHVDANATGASGLSAWRTLLLLKQLRTLPDIRHVTLSGNELENYCTRRPSYKKNGAGGRRGKKGRGVKQNHVAAATTKQQKKQEDDKKEDSEMKTEKGSEKDGAEESKEGKLCNGCEESGTSVDSEELSEQERVEEEDEWGKTEDYAITEGPDDEDDCLVKEEGPIKSRRVSKKDDEGVDDVGEPVPELLSSGENTGDEAFFDRDERQGQKEGQEQEEEVEEDIEASAKVLLREVRQSVIVGRRRARRRRRRGEDDEQEDGRVALIDEEGPVSLLQDLLLRGVICLQIKECSLIEQTRLAVWVLNVCHLLRLRQLDLGRSNKSLAETMPDEPVLLSNGELLRRVCLMSRPLWRRRMRSSDILTPFHALDDWQEWMLPYFWLYALLDCMLLYGHNRRKALPADTGDDSKKTSYSNGAKDVDHSLAGEKDKSGRGVPTLAKVPPAPLSSSSPPSSSHSRVRGDGGASSLLQHSSLQRYPLVRVWAVPGASFPLGGAGLRLPPGCAGFW